MIKKSEISVEYVDHMGDDLTVVNAARVSFNKKVNKLLERDEKLIKYLADNKHMSPFEHCSLSVKVKCPLYIRSQIMRHRTFSYNEISRRYTSIDVDFYIPKVENIHSQSKDNRQCSTEDLSNVKQYSAYICMSAAVDYAMKQYKRLLELGVSREIARSLLPQCTMTEFYMTGNLRNWVHFVKLRESLHAQKEARTIAGLCKSILCEKFKTSSAALFNVE